MRLSLQKVQQFGPKLLPHKQSFEQPCVVPPPFTAPQAENSLHLYCLAARKFSKLANFCYPYPYEPYPQFTEQKAIFLLFLINELIDASIEDQLGCTLGMVWGEVTYKVEEVVVL